MHEKNVKLETDVLNKMWCPWTVGITSTQNYSRHQIAHNNKQLTPYEGTCIGSACGAWHWVDDSHGVCAKSVVK